MATQHIIRDDSVVTTGPVVTRPNNVFFLSRIIWDIAGAINILLGVAFILKLIGANPNSGFVRFIYNLTAPLAAPFTGILPVSVSGTSVADWSLIIAMVVYAFVAYLLVRLATLLAPDEV
jgi:uncharacterized protein YggT (Ycf19 family)